MEFLDDLNSVVDSAVLKLEYYAGKRSGSPERYRLLAPCCEDRDMLLGLASEGCDLISATLGRAPDESQKSCLSHALVCFVIFRWLEILGEADAASWKADFEYAFGLLQERSRRFGPLKCRILRPF